MSYEIKVWNGGNPSYNRQTRTDAVKYIAIHYTADGQPDSHTAYNAMVYFSGGNRDASAHFFIDNYDIYEYADPAKWSCWHVGDGKGAYGITNQNSIGIEVVQDGDAPFSDEEIRKLTWLVQKLMQQFNVPAERVVRHYDASRKACPWYYTKHGSGGDAAWAKLHATITSGTALSGNAATKVSVADIAARIHYDMVTDERNGYSQAPQRWGGDYGGTKTLELYGRRYTYKLGSYDCSSSCITAWKLALQGTPYEGKLDAATCTSDMRAVFVGSGLFIASLTPAKRGDLYLAEGKHTAMCQDGGSDGVFGYDCLTEFNRNENGGAYNGKPGDQDGQEAILRGYYDDGWNTVLHYNGKADYYIDGGDKQANGQSEDEMICIIQPNGKDYLAYFDGSKLYKLGDPDEAEALKEVYRKTHNGSELPMFAFGSEKAPWATRLADAVSRPITKV